jgi:hypothetical protein
MRYRIMEVIRQQKKSDLEGRGHFWRAPRHSVCTNPVRLIASDNPPYRNQNCIEFGDKVRQERTLVLNDAIRSQATAAFRAAVRLGGNSDQSQRIPQRIHSCAKYQDHNTRHSAHHSNLPRYGRAGSS